MVHAKDHVVVVIDPGHGGYSEDASAYGAVYKDDLCEKDVNLITAYAIRDELSEYNNVEVYLTRDDDTKLSLDERVDFALSVGADVLISCHYNASESHIFYGSEIFTSAFGRYYMTGNALGQCIMQQWVDDGLNEKGIKTRIGSKGEDYYGIIRYGRSQGLPVIIIEHGYLDNHIDYERLGVREDWERMGRLDATGIARYYGLSKDRVLGEINETVHVGEPEGRVEPDTTVPEGIEFSILETDIDTGEITYEISADEPDSRLMYYGIALGEPDEVQPSDFADLILWENGSSRMVGKYSLPTGYRGKVTARVYNSYELFSDSESLEVDMATQLAKKAQELEAEAEESRKTAELKRKEAADRKLEEAKKKEERDALGNFFFFVGGDKSGASQRKVTKRELYTEITLAIVLAIVLICLIVIRHRKKITKYIKDMDVNKWDRY